MYSKTRKLAHITGKDKGIVLSRTLKNISQKEKVRILSNDEIIVIADINSSLEEIKDEFNEIINELEETT